MPWHTNKWTVALLLFNCCLYLGVVSASYDFHFKTCSFLLLVLSLQKYCFFVFLSHTLSVNTLHCFWNTNQLVALNDSLVLYGELSKKSNKIPLIAHILNLFILSPFFSTCLFYMQRDFIFIWTSNYLFLYLVFGMWGMFFLQVSHYFLKFIFSAIVTTTVRACGCVSMYVCVK